jgi:UDPglucose--hexose-1-phosphate uridylyltransferase
MPIEFHNYPHRRFNPLNGGWVLVSPERTVRPWLGQVDAAPEYRRNPYDPKCYLCPGNVRSGGVWNPQYESTFVFDNDYPALLPAVPMERDEQADLIIGKTEAGICRVACFSPQHDLTIPLMTTEAIGAVVEMWVDQHTALGNLSWVNHVQIFENRGALMGASNPHPHCQIWANATIPDEPQRELHQLSRYLESKGRCLLCDYLELELKLTERIVCENEGFAALVPYWAVWPFELLVLSKRHCGTMSELPAKERHWLADILRRVTVRYDNLFEAQFPYSMGFHQSPTDGERHSECHFHAHYYPPLLRSATVKKFMVGYELLANPQRDITAETSAARMRDAAENHYLHGAA